MQRVVKRKNKIQIINIVLIIFIIIFIFSSYKVFIWVKSDRKLKKMEEGLYKEVVSVKPTMNLTDTETQESVGSIEVDFKKLKEINKDVIGWIKIYDTYINYPIMKGKTDEYYLRKDIYGDYNYSGSIFVYSNVNEEFEDENTLIYGHNMKNDRMFANLQKIYTGELGKNIDVEIYTENSEKIYRVFSVYVCKPDSKITKNSFTEEEKKKYIDDALSKSKINFNQDINYSNNMITLVTCGNSNKERIVVHAIEK